MKKFLPITISFVLTLVAIVSTSAQVNNTSRESKTRPSDSLETNADTAASGTAAKAQKYYNSGLDLYNSGRTEEAIGSFKRANKIMPRDPQTLYMLGMAYSKSKAYREAADSFKRAVSFKSEWPEAHFGFGVMSHVLGRRSQSMEAYAQLLRLNSPLANKLYRIIKEEGTTVTDTESVAGDNELLSLNKGDVVPAAMSVQGVPAVADESTPVPIGKENSLSKAPAAAPPSSLDSGAASRAPDSTLTSIYRVGVGDVLDIRLLNSWTPRSTLYTVIAGGFIDFPIAGGSIAVMGLTADEIQTHIASELKRRAVEEGARVSVGVRQYASHNVTITGLVNSPGTKFLRREAVPVYVILAEAQTRLDAGRLSIIRSDSGETQSLDLADPASLNFLVRAGDMLSVTGKPQEFYYIAGLINYPGQKIFQPGITLLQAILAAGGLVRQIDTRIDLARAGADGHLTTTTFKMKEIKSGAIQDPKLQAGDRIEVIH